MSDAVPELRASLLVAEYVSIDAQDKINVIGGGITLLGFMPDMGTTVPFGVLVRITSPTPRQDQPAVEIVLADASGQPVVIPGPAGPQAMRIAQNVQFATPAVAGLAIPTGAVPSLVQWVIMFGSGLPLAPGHSYSWRVQIDHDVIASESFFIPAPPPGPVIG